MFEESSGLGLGFSRPIEEEKFSIKSAELKSKELHFSRLSARCAGLRKFEIWKWTMLAMLAILCDAFHTHATYTRGESGKVQSLSGNRLGSHTQFGYALCSCVAVLTPNQGFVVCGQICYAYPWFITFFAREYCSASAVGSGANSPSTYYNLT